MLQRDGDNVVTADTCRIISGIWLSPYDNKRVMSPSEMEVGHLVPLADAWRSGAWAWTEARRQAFANDLVHPELIAVSTTSHRSKEDRDPSRWKPRAKAFWCDYAKYWTRVKSVYRLTVTAPERAALAGMLDTCRT